MMLRPCLSPLVLAAAGLLAGVTARADVDALLPPSEAVVRVMQQLPAVRGGQAGRTQALARQQRLLAGPHEWTVRIGAQQRRERLGPRYAEQEVGVERALRSPGKRDIDRLLGDSERHVADLQQADIWHETARSLMAAWFDWLRGVRAATVLDTQAAVAREQQAVAERRWRAGEAARLETLTAQAEVDRASATAAQARERAAAVQAELAARYPGLPLVVPAVLPEPAPIPRTADAWVQAILDDNHERELAEARAELARRRAQRVTQDQQADPTLGLRGSRERGGQEQVLGVYLSLPIGSDAREADTRLALAEAEALEQQARDTVLRTEATARRVALEVVQRPATWRSLDAAMTALRESARLSLRAYALGETPLQEALQARRTALDAELAAEAARIDALESLARAQLDAHEIWQPPGGHHHPDEAPRH